MNVILIGAGSRGMIYGNWLIENGHTVKAVADPRTDRLMDAGIRFNVSNDCLYTSGEDLLSRGKIADAALICTQDRDHFGHVMAALDCGYDILLEKPISPDPRECIAIEHRAIELGRKITVCHVLRYTSFFSLLKDILDSGTLGKVVAIQHAENIGNYHMAHSFVRGNWRNDRLSSPIIMQKSCHDLDILLWLTGAHCSRVSAFGSLHYFTPEHAPSGASDRCLDCNVSDNCRFNAWKVYKDMLGRWPADVVTLEPTEAALRKALENGPYGRCVYHCDNNVCDHMSIILEFDSGATAAFSLTAQTCEVHRSIHIMCEDGEIEADTLTNQITVRRFRCNPMDQAEVQVIDVQKASSGHGGGDSGIMEDFASNFTDPLHESRSSISRSVESHLMACAIEQSRLTGQTVYLDQYRASLL